MLEPVVDRFAKAESKDGRDYGLQLEGDVCHMQAPVADACCQDLYGYRDRSRRIRPGLEQASTDGEAAAPHCRRPPMSPASFVCYAGGVACSGVNSFSPFQGRVLSPNGVHVLWYKIW